MKRIAIAGSTGYLGKCLVKESIEQKIQANAIARNLLKLNNLEGDWLQKTKADVTKPETLKGVLHGVDTVISTVGITRQKDGLTYLDVDYGANKNLLLEAKKAGVRKFIYISAFKGNELRHLKMVDAKERFVDELKNSGMDYTIIRPTGFFSDMRDFLKMAEGGRVYLFGNGNLKLNPIHGEDLAKVCFNAINSSEKEINVGGPETFTHNKLGGLALKTLKKPVKIMHLPDWIRLLIIWGARTFSSLSVYGPLEFFLTAMAINMEAPKYGKKRLADFYSESV
jgi:uncharacterized protein YbjT (DUF2867 family)